MVPSVKKSPAKRRRSGVLSPSGKRNLLLELFGHLEPNINAAALRAIDDFRSRDDDGKIAESSKIVSETVINASKEPDIRFGLAVDQSESLLPGYATLDVTHRLQIKGLIDQITSYLRDGTRKRPFNSLMLASPGVGKSHFIKQLAAAMANERVQAVTFNMATMQSADDMAHASRRLDVFQFGVAGQVVDVRAPQSRPLWEPARAEVQAAWR